MTCLFDPACKERMPSEAPCRPTKKARSLSDIDFLPKDSDKINDRVQRWLDSKDFPTVFIGKVQPEAHTSDTLDRASMMMDGANSQDFASEPADSTEHDAAAIDCYSVQKEALAMTGKFVHDHQCPKAEAEADAAEAITEELRHLAGVVRHVAARIDKILESFDFL